ncbi:allophanate hydrolase [Spirochaetia bacterium]|nr:allophanate hydrolase [Spirochaetia bacterium]
MSAGQACTKGRAHSGAVMYPAGDCALAVEFGQAILPELNDKVHALAGSLRQKPVAGINGLVPSYASLLVYFDPLKISSRALAARIKRRLAKLSRTGRTAGKTVRIPVCYEGAFSPDMENVSQHTGLSPAEIIERHSKPVYRIYMMGFLPGFPYLGGLDPVLETPRLANPRTVVPAGAVGIGGFQTGIYPLDSPGGWQLIGRTPLRPWDPYRAEPFLYQSGDNIVFYPVNTAEYERIAVSHGGGTWD